MWKNNHCGERPKMKWRAFGVWKRNDTELYLLFVIITSIMRFLAAFAQNSAVDFFFVKQSAFCLSSKEREENNKQRYKNDDDEKKNDGSYARKKSWPKSMKKKWQRVFRVSAAVTEGRRRSRRSFRYNFYTYTSNLSLVRWNMRRAAKIWSELQKKRKVWRNSGRPMELWFLDDQRKSQKLIFLKFYFKNFPSTVLKKKIFLLSNFFHNDTM